MLEGARFFLTSALDGGGWSSHAPAALHPGKTQYLLYSRLGGSQGQPGRVRKISPPPRFDRPARSESLSRPTVRRYTSKTAELLSFLV